MPCTSLCRKRAFFSLTTGNRPPISFAPPMRFPRLFQIERRALAKHRLSQKRRYAAIHLLFRAFQLQIKTHRVDIQPAADKKRIGFIAFAQTSNELRQHAGIKLIYAFDAAPVAGRNRIARHHQHVMHVFHRKAQQQGLRCVHIAVAAGHMWKRFDPKFPRQVLQASRLESILARPIGQSAMVIASAPSCSS